MAGVREAHFYIQGVGDGKLALEILRALHPEYLSQIIPPKLVTHAVTGAWPSDMFLYAYSDLRANYRIHLSDSNCLTQEGAAYGKKLYMVYLL